MKRLLALLSCCCLAIAASGPSAQATRGDLLATFSFNGAGLSLDAARHRMLITDSTNNKLVVIDTRTLQQLTSVGVGSHPVGVALSPDGNNIYVANSNSLSISVLAANPVTLSSAITTPYAPWNVAVGRRLYASPGNTSDYLGIMQFNTDTGGYLGQFDGGTFVYYCGLLQISPDQKTLYFANVGLSPGTLAKYDISTDTPVRLWANAHGALGSNGEDLTLSHAGDSIYYCVGGGNSGYTIARIRTSDMTVLGYLNTGAYPTALALSPDDKVAYTISTTGHIDIFDTSTFANIGQITTSTSDDYYGAQLIADDSGTRLFVAYPNSYYNTPRVRVYETGFAPNVSPPAGVAVAISAPTSGPTYSTNSATVDLSGTASETDSSGSSLGWGYLGSISWSNNRGGSGAGTCSNSLVMPASWSLKGVTLRGGDNLITVTGIDMWGNRSTATITVTAPSGVSVSISQPSDQPAFSTISGSIGLSGTAGQTDSSGAALGWAKLSTVKWSNSRGGSGTGTYTNYATTPTTWSISSVPLQGGDNAITVTATDVWGNTGTDTITVAWVPGSVGAAKRQSSGTVYVHSAIVTATTIAPGNVFVEAKDLSSGVRLVTNQALNVGDEVAFTGVVGRVNGEYQISGVTFITTNIGSPLPPIFFGSNSIGNDRTESLHYTGLDATGMLTRTSGKVAGTVSTQQIFYVDDGNMYQDGVGPVTGLRVHCPSGVALPRVGKWVTVSGISRVEKITLTGWGEVNGDWYPSGTVLYVPSIWARSAADIQQLSH